MTTENNHWLEPVLAESLNRTEAPTTVVFAPAKTSGFFGAKLAVAAALLLVTVVSAHLYMERLAPGETQAAGKPVQFRGACTLCHSAEYL